MSFKKLNVEELIILKEKEISMDKVNEIFKFENNGTILIIDEENIFKGIITLGDYKRAVKNNEEVQINSNCKYFKQGEDTIESLSELNEKYPNIMMLPVLSENREILYGIDMKADKYINSKLEIENYLYSEWAKIKNEENFEDILQSYIEYKGYNNIAIFGVSKFVLNFADDVNRVNKVIRNIYDYNNKEMYCKRLYLANYDTEVKLIDDIDELIEKHSTIIFLNEKYYSRNMVENLVFLKDFIEDLKRNYRFEYYKNNLNQLGVKLFKVGMPSTLDFIKAKVKINNFNIKEFFENNEGTPTIEEYGNFVNFTIRTDGVRVCTDCNTEGVNIIEGRRLTLNQPKIFKNTIYLFGPCIVQGTYANDENTVGTNLQKLINKIGLNYRVEAIPIGGQGRIEWICALRMIDKLNIKKGDKIIFVDQSLEFNYDIDLNMYEEFLKLYREEPKIFLNSPIHCGPKGYKKLAESIFYKLILNNKEFEESICEENNLNFDRKITRNFDFLDRNKILGVGLKTGAIVMNCNPFTLGHRYLVETAAKQVDLLYIFVVQEDKSFFKFKDRFWLVKKGVEDLDNVVVIPSGRYIISSDTFSDYFDKENKTKHNFNIDTSTDVRLFCEYVAPILGITVRFVGTEPLDYVTNVYNNTLQETLPQYGIELKVIDRKEKDGEVISASRVRKLLNEKEFEKIKKLVPKSTYEFLISRYNEKVGNR